MASNSALIIPPRSSAPATTATNDIRAIKPPVEIRDWRAIGLWSGGALLAATLLSVLVWLWWRNRPKPQPVVIPPHVRAREKLEAALLLINDPRAFCIAVSDAVRWYLEERFQLRAPERTTEEFLRDLKATTHLNAGQKQSLGAFLEHCDLVKFARFEPTEAALRELHESALRLVHETQYVAQQATTAAAAAKPELEPPPLPQVLKDAPPPVRQDAGDAST
jgi:hypothetical protein